mmetsp:Transcript_6397/g.18439  ORF Transcript_6397/g.18439 Transcript_6397/m.18439 type:complete len:300 (-) Transcript_6397:399-1298(-)
MSEQQPGHEVDGAPPHVQQQPQLVGVRCRSCLVHKLVLGRRVEGKGEGNVKHLLCVSHELHVQRGVVQQAAEGAEQRHGVLDAPLGDLERQNRRHLCPGEVENFRHQLSHPTPKCQSTERELDVVVVECRRPLGHTPQLLLEQLPLCISLQADGHELLGGFGVRLCSLGVFVVLVPLFPLPLPLAPPPPALDTRTDLCATAPSQRSLCRRGRRCLGAVLRRARHLTVDHQPPGGNSLLWGTRRHGRGEDTRQTHRLLDACKLLSAIGRASGTRQRPALVERRRRVWVWDAAQDNGVLVL